MAAKTPTPRTRKAATPGKKTAKKTAKSKRANTVEWKPFTIPGIDVRLWKAFRYDDDGDETVPFGVPTADPNYVFREDLIRELAWAVWPHDNPKPYHAENWTPSLLAGPKGSGKTSLVLQVAALCNIPVWRINLNVGTTVRHLKGRIGAEPGRTVFVPGVVTSAMERGGWLILDEFAAGSPPVLLSLFPVLEPDGAVLLEDAQPPRYVRRHPEFRVFGTDNALGAGMETDRFAYTGTNPDMNEALLDRFGSFVEVPYMDESTERTAIASKIPGLDGQTVNGMVRVANGIREGGEVSGGFSTRMLIDWGRRIAAGTMRANGKLAERSMDDTDVLHAAYGAFLNRQKSAVERDAIVEKIKRIFTIMGE